MWLPDRRRLHRLSGLASWSRDMGPAVERLGHVALRGREDMGTLVSLQQREGEPTGMWGVAGTLFCRSGKTG